MGELEIEIDWDPVKDASNLRKHGIGFFAASRIFFSPRIDEPASQSGSEARRIAIGDVLGTEIAVVYTIRNGVYRIISARKASKRERAAYRQIYPQRDS